MAALSFSSSVFSICKKIPNSNQNAEWHLKRNHIQAVIVNRQSGPRNSMKKSRGALSSIHSESSNLTDATDHHGGAAITDAGFFVSQPNGGGSSSVAAAMTPQQVQVEVEVTDHQLHNVSEISTDSTLEMANENGIGIKKFLVGKTLFVTGATGFLGKVLIEKILRSVPDIAKIYILVKANNMEIAMKRIENEIIDGELFKCLKQQHGKSYSKFMLSKMEPILGNICENNLGLDTSVAAMIAKEVDIIVNSAANTTFDERYDVALDINTCGPRRLMSFAKQCPKIKLFLQVSTAYVNGQRQGVVMEKPFYSGQSILRGADLNIDDEIKLVEEAKLGLDENGDDLIINQKMKKLGIERAKKFGWQDSYVFTKAMGEMMIDNMRGDLPVVTIRPSIIESTCKEPFPGWIEGNRMMDPIVLSYGKGQIPGFTVDPNAILDVVPADMVVNAIIAAMAKHVATGKPGINVYHIASSVVNPLVNKDLLSYLFEYFNSSPIIDSKGTPVYVSRFKVFSCIEDFSHHLWREAIERVDRNGAAHQMSQKAMEKLESLCKKSIEQTMYLASIYNPYTFYKGRFDSTNARILMECMSNEEKMEFGFDVNEIDWKEYMFNIHIPGLKKHVMKGRLG